MNEEEKRNQSRAMRITALVLGLASMICLFFVVYANIQVGYAKERLWKQEIEFEQTKARLINRIDSLETVNYYLEKPTDTVSNED